MRDVFAVDFQPGHPDVVLFGGRPGYLHVADTRQRQQQQPPAGRNLGGSSNTGGRETVAEAGSTLSVGCGASVARLHPVGEHEVLVAGPRDLLAVYDLRFVSRANDDSNSNSSSIDARNTNSATKMPGNRGAAARSPGFGAAAADAPVVRFDGYRNPARLDAGLAYDASSGIVAAAHAGPGPGGDGTVALYSARTGRRLRWCRDLEEEDQGRKQCRNNYGGGRLNEPIRCLQFRRWPGDELPSLFVGERKGLQVYSIGGAGDDDDDDGGGDA